MKNSIPSNLRPLSKIGTLTLAALACWLTTPLRGADIFWTGGTASYTTAGNWSTATVPGAGDNAINTNGLANGVLINVGDPDWAVNDLSAGGGPEAGGAYVQNGRTLTVNSWLHIADGPNSAGVFTLNGGIVNVPNGQLFLCESPGSTGTLNINGGTINKAGDTFRIADGGWNGSGARTGIVNQVAGTVECSSELWVGQVSGGMGFYNLSGGAINLHNWLVIGRSGGSGTVTMTGGTFTKDGNGAFIVGSGGGTVGVLNQSAGTIHCPSEYWLAEGGGAEAANNISGTAVVNIDNWVSIGRGGHAVINFSGGAINKTGGGNFIVGDNGNALFNQSGGTLTINGEVWIGQWHDGTGQFDLSAGTVTNNSWLAVGREGADGVLNISGGSMTKTGGGNISIAHGQGGFGASGTVNQTGGSFTCASGELWIGEDTGPGIWNISGGTATFGYVQLARNSSASGNLNLNGGTFTATEITTGSSGTSTLDFNGGTLRAGADSVNFLHDLTVAQVDAGGAIFDSQAFNITVAQSLMNSGGGGLTKNGAGTLTLTGANGYTGTTAVNAGKLITSTASTGGGDFTVANGAGLGVTVQSANAQLGAPNVTLAAATAASLDFDLGSFGNPTAAPLNVTTTFAVNGTITVNIADALPQVGQFPLVQYAARTGAGNFVLGTFPAGLVANILTNGNTIALNISAVNVPRWDGQAGGNWDIGLTLNWFNIGTGLPTTYGEGNTVAFDDSALGTTAVNLVATVNPSSVTVTNTALSYSISGPGKISGATGLTKQGANTLTIANSGGNNYTGQTILSGGTVSVASLASGGVASAIGASSASATNLVFNGGSLSYTGPAVAINRGYSVQAGGGALDTVGNLTLSGLATAVPGGGFTKTGPAQLAYTGVGINALAGGAYVVRDGTLVLDGSAGGQTNNISGALSLNGAVTALARLTNTTLNCGDLYVGNESGMQGSVVIENGTAINDNSWFIIDNATATINGGSITVPGRLFLCERPGTTATLNINGGVINQNGDYFAVVNGGWNGAGARTGVVNQVAGTVGGGAEMWVGDSGGPGGNDSLGIYNLSGETLTVNNWMGVGRDGCQGIFNLTGGTFNKGGGGDMVIGRGGDNTIGTFNMSAGTLHKSSGNPLIIGQNSGHGLFNQSGGTLTVDSEYWVGVDGNTTDATNNISGTAVFNINNWLSLGRGGRAVVNFSGGQINKSGGGAFIVGDNGNSVFSQTGGTNDTFGELWIAQAGGGVGEYNLSSGMVTLHNWLAVGRESGQGTLNISGGSFTKDGNGNISITHNSGASGTVSITGGSFTCASGETWIGENGGPGIWNMGGGTATVGYVQLARNSDATGTLNLNGGTFTANEITTGSSGTSTLNFNGGTLAAGASTVNFLHGLTAANVQAGGAVINSDTNTISIAQPLLADGGAGGLTKVGTGTLRLNGVNTYTGSTLVSAGTLGGTGTIAGPVTVAAGASLAPGASIGTLTVNNSVTLGGTTAMEISKDGGVPASDLLAVSGNLSFGGTLTVALTGTNALVFNDTFNLFDWGTQSGSFAAMNLPAGYLWDPSQLNVNGTIRVIGVQPPAISSSTVVGANLIVTGVGGPPGASYTWITATNVAAPLANWTTNLTGVFDGSGGFSNAISINTGERARFFRMQTP